MTFCCKHTEKAHELIQEACSQMMGKSINETSEGGKIFRTIIPWASNYDKAYLSSAIKDYKDWMSTARDYLQRAEREMSACNCSEEEKKKNIRTTEKKTVLEEKLGIKETELTKITNEFNDLRVEDQNLINKNKSLKKQVRELSKYKLRSLEGKLKQSIRHLKISEEKEDKVVELCEKLCDDRLRKDDSKVKTAEKNIEKILRAEIDLGEIQRISEVCGEIAELKEQIAELEVQLKRIQQQEEESKEQNESKNWRNINSNFTLKLIRKWQDLGFTYGQCADWIRINSNQRQDQAIKEFAYYAWLRDEKKVNAEWILSNGSEQELRQEFLLRKQWQQQYFSAQEHKS